MAKAKFDMRMNTLGEILEVEVSQETLEGLKSLPNAQQMGSLFSKENLVGMIKQGAPAMPKQPVQNQGPNGRARWKSLCHKSAKWSL